MKIGILRNLAFISKIEKDVSRKIFSDTDSLKEAFYSSCVLYLKQTGKIESHDFDDSINSDATLKDLDEIKLKNLLLLPVQREDFL
jgi:ATP-dependent DNA helicase RecG